MKTKIDTARLTDSCDKHLQLDEAISGIDRVSARLEDLACRIRSNESAPPNATDAKIASAPSLTDVLEGGHDKINAKVERCLELTSEISQLLF